MSANDIETLTLQEVADELGVHYMTAYRYVRIGVLPARKEGRSWKVLRADLEAMTAEPEVPPARRDAPWGDRFVARLVAGDEAGAWTVVEGALAAGATPGEVLTGIVAPSLQIVGDRWEEGDIGVDEEHAASGICGRILARLGSRFARRGVSKGTVVLGTTATDLHDLPTAIAAELLRIEGYEVVNLGAFLPPEDFARAVRRAERLVAVGVAATMANPEALRETVAALKGATSMPVYVGGSGIHSDAEAVALGADGWAKDASGLLALLAGPGGS